MKLTRKLLAALLALALLLSALPAALAAPSDTLTRGEAADLLLQAADSYNSGVKRADILKGYPDGSLDENGSVTRAQALVMLSRAFGTLPTPVGDNARSGYDAANFTDIPAWAKAELSAVWKTGIVAGTSGRTFSPNAKLTRNQLDLLIRRMYALEGTNLRDDFYATVNKTALDKSVILPGQLGAGSFSNLAATVNGEVASIIREVAANPKTPGEQKIATLYRNILSTAARDQAGITPIKSYLAAIDGAKSVAELMQAHNRVSSELGASLLLGFSLTTDAKDSNSYLLSFGGISPTLGKSGYAHATAAQKGAYLTYLGTLMKLLGKSESEAAGEAQLIWNADAALAAASLSNQERGDVDKTYNIFTMAQLQAMFPNIDLAAVFAASGLTQTDRICVSDTGLLRAFAALCSDSHLDTLKAYCRLALASGYGPLLNHEFTDAGNAFNLAYLGMTSPGGEDLAARYVQLLMSDYLGQAYVSRHFSAAAKTNVEKMVRDILAVYQSRIEKLDWMSDATKARAIRKLSAVTLKIGYPDKWDDSLSGTAILPADQGGSFFTNVVAISKTSRAKTAQAQKDGVDKSSWDMPPYTVNAYYDASANSINFPAGILQAPFYDVNASYEQNLGGIGYVIAHEITHAFDNNGAKYDENGNAADWWTKEDYTAFQSLCGKVVALYNGRESAPGITCDGTLTLSENIADLGAAACLTELESRRAAPDYRALYTAMGQIWCASYPRALREYLAMADVHAPDKLRGSLVLQQFEPFYTAFGIHEGDGMWLAPEDRVNIW